MIRLGLSAKSQSGRSLSFAERDANGPYLEFDQIRRILAVWRDGRHHQRPLEPIRKLLESDESDVIPCQALDSVESARFGNLNTAVPRIELTFVTRVI